MKALQITKYGELEEGLSKNKIDKPTIKAEDLLIEVKAAALNPIDYKLVEGKLKDMVSLNFDTTIGFDVSGVVVKKGDQVKDFNVGDEVYSRVPQDQMGTVAEFVAVNSNVVCKKPKNISFEEASGLPLAGLTAIQALNSVGIKAKDKVLIHAGSGGVGSLAIQYAKEKGAEVYTTTSTDNLDWVKDLGADRVIDYTKENYKKIATDLDIVLDTLGDDYTFEAFELIKEGGSVSTLVGPPDKESAEQMGMKDYNMPEKLEELINKKSAKYKLTWMEPKKEHLQLIKELVENNKMKPIVDRVYNFDEGIEAYKYLDDGHAKGKVIIKMK